MKKLTVFLTVTIGLFWFKVAFSQADTSEAGKEIMMPGVSGEMGSTLLKMGLALLLIIVLIYLSVFMLKRLSTGRMGRQSLSGAIEVVDRHFLSPKKQVCILKVEKKYLLVGVTEQAVNLVADVSDQEFVKPQTASTSEKQGFSFKRFFNDAKLHLPMFSQQTENPQEN
jgi:flagellar biogenesis protein FliO